MKTIIGLGIFIFTANVFAQADLPELAKVKAAAESGDAAAQEKLAEQFQNHGDPAQAINWYRKAAVRNSIGAQSKLGNLLLIRYEMHVDDAKPQVRAQIGGEAYKWISQAANEGDRASQVQMAKLYFDGFLVQKNLIVAYKWAELAARGSQNDSIAFDGKTIRDAAILKLTTAQIEEARKLADNFKIIPITNAPVVKK